MKSAINKIKISNIIFILLLVAIVVNRFPVAYKNWNLQGTESVSNVSLRDINNQPLEIKPPYAMIFWATWCAPCKLELFRINGLIKNKKIEPSKIIAISIDDSEADVKSFIENNKYEFSVVWDGDGKMAQQYSVSGTPTIIVLNQESKISWATMGISPLLEYKLLNMK